MDIALRKDFGEIQELIANPPPAAPMAASSERRKGVSLVRLSRSRLSIEGHAPQSAVAGRREQRQVRELDSDKRRRTCDSHADGSTGNDHDHDDEHLHHKAANIAPNGRRLCNPSSRPLAPLDDLTQLYAVPNKVSDTRQVQTNKRTEPNVCFVGRGSGTRVLS